MTSTNPRHRHTRVTFGGAVAVKARNRPNEPGIIKDVSEAGALLLSTHRYSRGTEVVMYMPLEVGRKKSLCMISGKIVRVDEGTNTVGVQGYGIQFDPNVPKGSKQLLQDFVTLKTTGKLPERDVGPRRVSQNRD